MFLFFAVNLNYFMDRFSILIQYIFFFWVLYYDCCLDYLVADQLYNKIAIKVKIAIQMDFTENCLVAKSWFHNEIIVQVKIPIQVDFIE